MAKHLLLSILEDVLGDFIFGLTKENLKVGVFSGRLEFHNLVLKTGPLGGVLRDLMLPIAVTNGFIKHIDISIPWASLGKNPVRVVVEDLLLQLRPLDPATEHLSAAEAEAAAVKRNKAILVEEMKKLVESLIFSSEQQNPAVKALVRLLLANKRFSSISSILRATPTHSGMASANSSKSQSYLQRLVTKILDNLEVSVKNVHIRYEDAVSLPRHVISAGITLSELTLSAADENWQPRKAKASSQAAPGIFSMRKLFDLEDLSAYCHTTESLSFSDISPFSAWCDCMVAVIYSSQRHPDLEYILVPPNAVQIRFNHREIASESDPKVSIGFIGQLTLALSKNQLSHIATAVTTLMEIVLQRDVNIMRPKVRPTADKKLWWRFIFMLVRRNYERSVVSATSIIYLL
jgi:vacuolar protein sorting-associated protein 13A/C